MNSDFENPFADYGSVVRGERFIGRTENLKVIENRYVRPKESGNLAIIGEPRIGKSSLSRSKSFPRIRFYGCPGVQKLYFCTAASPGGPMQKYNFCTPPETFRSTESGLPGCSGL
jgi:hypothetical protein